MSVNFSMLPILTRGGKRMKPFMPKLVYFEPKALEYPLGKELYEKFTKMGLEIRETTSHNQIRNLPGENDL